MPSHNQCEIKQLNARLKDIKQDKVVTLKQILEVTEELGHDHPHRRDEVARSKRQIQRKLLDAITKLMYLNDKIARVVVHVKQIKPTNCPKVTGTKIPSTLGAIF